jgi:hypothetical protein
MSKKSLATKQHNKRYKNRTNKPYVEQKLSAVGLLETLLRKSNHTFDELEKLLLARGSNEQRRLKIHHNSTMARELDKYVVRLMKSNQHTLITDRAPQLLRKIEEFQRKSEELSDDTLTRGAQLDMAEDLLRVICKIGRLIVAILIDESKRTGIYRKYECRRINTKHFRKSAALDDKAAVVAGARMGQEKRTKALVGKYPRRTLEASGVMPQSKKDLETRRDFGGDEAAGLEGLAPTVQTLGCRGDLSNQYEWYNRTRRAEREIVCLGNQAASEETQGEHQWTIVDVCRLTKTSIAKNRGDG